MHERINSVSRWTVWIVSKIGGPVVFQVDDLQKDVSALKDRVHEQRAINESRASKQEENMNGLRTHLQQLVDDVDQEDGRIKTVHTELIELLESVEKLFLSVHCDLSPMYKILGKRYTLSTHIKSIYYHVNEYAYRRFCDIYSNIYIFIYIF